MTERFGRFGAGVAVVGVLMGLAGVVPALAQAPSARGQQAQLPRELVAIRQYQSREDIREGTRAVLEKYPPSLGLVLRLDPALLTNDAYLAPYPELRTFLEQYPEVARTPAYYLSFIRNTSTATEPSASDRQWDFIRNITEMISVGFVMSGIAFVLLWLVRHFLAHRRWLRSTKLQMDVHNRLMERLQTGEDVRHYLESAASARLLADTPSLSGGGGIAISPVGRILLAVQVGVVLASTGIGILLAKSYITPNQDAADTMVFFGTMGLAIGVGFALAAAASFVLSRRFGLLTDSAPSASNQAGS